VKAAANILEKMNESVEPCEDFYSFACGQFVKDAVIPGKNSGVNSLSLVLDTIEEQMKSILSSPIEESDIEPVKNVKKLYSACMDTETIEKRGLDGMKKIMESMGGWPVVKGDNWNETQWTWQKAEIDGFKNGFSQYFVYVSMGSNGIEVSFRQFSHSNVL
jgi:neprilysin